MAIEPLAQAEQIVVGAAMLATDPAVVAELGDIVSAADFDRPAHATIWQAITAQHTVGHPTDPAAVGLALADTKELNRVGGTGYLITLVQSVPTVDNAAYYARQVAEAAKRRRVAEAGVRIAQAAATPGADVARIIEDNRGLLTGASIQEWTEPVPLTVETDLPAFPVDALPGWVGDMVNATATTTQTPADLAGSLVLSCLSAAVAGRLLIEPVPGWVEQASLYTCVALGPGNRKSAVFDRMTRPLRDAERFLVEQARPLVIEARTEKAIAVRAAEKALMVASGDASNPDAVNDAKSAARDAEAIRVPAEPVLLADDITPEATKTLLAEQGGRLAIMSAEGGIFATIAGRYSGVPDLDPFLKGHAGDMLRVTRKSAPVEHIERPALTIGLSPQPSVVRDLARIPGFEERGLLARFLFSLPASMVGHRDPAPPAIPTKVAETYHRRLRELAVTMWHASETTLTLTPEARDRVIALEREREPKLAPGGEWEPIVNWANKWTGSVVVRIAGLLHVADNLTTGWRRDIEADTIDAAALIGYYFACHALAVWSYMGSDATGPAALVLDWIRGQRQPEWTRRDIHRALFRRLTLAELDAALHTLAEHGHIRIHAPKGKGRGRRPAPRIHVHPSYTGGRA